MKVGLCGCRCNAFFDGGGIINFDGLPVSLEATSACARIFTSSHAFVVGGAPTTTSVLISAPDQRSAPLRARSAGCSRHGHPLVLHRRAECEVKRNGDLFRPLPAPDSMITASPTRATSVLVWPVHPPLRE